MACGRLRPRDAPLVAASRMGESGPQPKVVQAIHDYKSKNNDEVGPQGGFSPCKTSCQTTNQNLQELNGSYWCRDLELSQPSTTEL